MLAKSHRLLRKLSRVESNFFLPVTTIGSSARRFLPVAFYSTRDPNQPPTEYCEGGNGIRKVPLAKNLANLLEESSNSPDKAGQESYCGVERSEKIALAKNLASLVQESYEVSNKKSKQKTCVEIKRFLEMRIKKKVKAQYRNGKYQGLMMKVIADPNTLKDAYDCIRLTSNVDLASDGDNLPFLSIAEELADGKFDVGANTYSLRTRGPKVKKEELVLPELKLRVVQEAIRIVLEVVYRPYFSRISHGLRSNRDHWSALKYIRKEIPDPDWWFTLPINKNLDDCILGKLLSTMEDKIEDPVLCGIIKDMFKARVINIEFGSFPKGHGLPQEGVLSPILMNIYLDLFDREVYKMSMHYETSYTVRSEEQKSHSKLRGWFRKQISGSSLQQHDSGKDSGVRVHCCRFMDEIFFAFSGSKEVALTFKSEIEGFLKNSLYLEVDDQADILASNDPRGVKFLGTLIRRRMKETPALRAVHKLKDKVKIFAEQKQESWDAGALRIGKKWLAHGLKKVKESEIKHLADSSSILHQISYYRRSGMKTDHWYKVLLKIWMQHVNAKSAGNEEKLLTKLVVEPALPPELRDAYFEFQKRAKEYVDSETSATLALLTGSDSSPQPLSITETVVPLNILTKRLHRYGLTNREGYARPCYVLILLDQDQIIDWFTGIVHRWLRWYRGCNNFNEVKKIICDQVRMSCIRTLAVKYRIHEADIEKKFDSQLSRIPSTQDIELEEENTELISLESNFDGALMYGIQYSGLCSLSLARMVSESRPCYCFAIGCSASVSCVYTLHVMERQKFPAWKTGFSSSIHPSLHRRRIGLCKKHVKDLFLGNMSLQSIEFGAWR
ncbi:nuclear intron maturase 4, mitochondrial isoform X2 [Salvia miltiorrhiza]|nr:nuclear intron maturase 4, mitochondrial isoform X2 [Salvia miltiorrhiza]XP_057784764.1 nuclear intron maturase 4, mitochondrial isoform X2 [Salvia miltiorrhiza]